MIYEAKVFKIAIFSRCLLIFIQYIFNYLISDHNPEVFRYTTNVQRNQYDDIVQHILGGFLRWDGQYYMHIARNGYTYENSMAFFPLFPVTVRLISIFIHHWISFLSIDSILLIVFIVFNFIIFVKAAVTLYKLSEIILYPSIAFKAAVLFAFNPASVFFSAPYTECLYCYLTFKTILNCLELYQKYSDKNSETELSDIFFIWPAALSTLTRSNGVLNIGFVVYTLICLFLKNYPVYNIFRKTWFIFKYIVTTILLTILSILPFVFYQEYCYNIFCNTFDDEELQDHVKLYADKKNFVLPGQFEKYNQSWCYQRVPLAYSYVQDHYWNVGFLNYYEIKQIPNFLLAAPILFILIYNCLLFLKNNFVVNITQIFSFNKIYERKKDLNLLYNPSLFVFVIHALALSIFCLLCIHIQVSTRMLCASTPFIYWICAYYLPNTNFNKTLFINSFGKFSENLIKWYFLSYYVIGTVLFCNYLPFT